MRTRLIFQVVAVLSLPWPIAMAATTLDDADTAAMASGNIDNATSKIGTPNTSSSFGTNNLFQVQASNGDSTVSIKTSLKRTLSNGGYSIFSLVGQAPTSKASSSSDTGTGTSSGTSLGSVDGLANGTTLALSFSNSILRNWGYHDDDKSGCQRFKALYESIPSNKSNPWQCDRERVQSLVNNKEIPDKQGPAPTQADFDQYASGYVNPSTGLLTYGGNVKGGYQDFDYYDATSLASESKREGLWSASVFAGYLFLERAMAFTGTLSVQSSYKDSKSSTKCLTTPPTGSTFVTCADGSIGAPAHNTTEVLALEWRQQVIDKVALSLQASRDFRNRITTAQLPVYFIQDAKSGLSGGLNVGWTSENHKTSLGVFVNQAFSLFN